MVNQVQIRQNNSRTADNRTSDYPDKRNQSTLEQLQGNPSPLDQHHPGNNTGLSTFDILAGHQSALDLLMGEHAAGTANGVETPLQDLQQTDTPQPSKVGDSSGSSSSLSPRNSSYGNSAPYSGPGSTFKTGGSDNFSAASPGSAHAYFSPGSSIGIDAIAPTPPPEDDDPAGFSATRDLAAELAASGLSFVTNNTPLPDLTPAEAREFLAEDQNRASHVSQVTADDGVVTTIGSYELDYETPDAAIENETFSAGFKAEVDGTAHTVETEGQIGSADIKGTRKVGTANANAVLEVNAGLDGSKPSLNVEASLGAEVMGVDVKAEGSVTFSPQDLFDGVADVYNATVDPIHERIVGHDVPDLEAFDVPEVIDREITISGHVEAGLGVSGKVSGGLNIGRTDDRSDGVFGLHRAGKGGVGLVIGAGASLVID